MANKIDEKRDDLMGKTEGDFIQLAKDRWQEGESFIEETITAGTLSLKAINGDVEAQWDKDVLARRKAQGRPTIVENLLPAFIRQVTGDFRMNTPAIKVVPDSLDADAKYAEVLQGKIYRIRHNSQADAIHQDAFEQSVKTAYGAWGMLTRYKDEESFEQEIYLRPFDNHHSLRWDPSCKLPDTSDKKWVQIYQEYTEHEAQTRWPDANWAQPEKGRGSENALWWADKKRGVCEYWYMTEKQKTIYLIDRETTDPATGQPTRVQMIVDKLPEGLSADAFKSRKAVDRAIYSCIYNGNEIIEGPTRWACSDQYIPVFLTFGEKLVIEGKTSYKSLIVDAVGIQQLHNYFVTSLTESIALQPEAQWVAEEGEIPKQYEPEWQGRKRTKVLKFKMNPSRPNGPKREAPPQLSQAHWMMPQYTKQAVRDTVGIQQAGLGMKSNETSGIAIESRKRESDVGTFIFVSNFKRAQEFEGKCLIQAIQKLDAQAGKHIVMNGDGENKVVDVDKAFDTGTYGTMITIGPSLTTQRQESRDALLSLIQTTAASNPVGTAAVLPKLVKVLDIPDAQEIADIYAATLDNIAPGIREKFYKKNDEQEQGQPGGSPEIAAQVEQMQAAMQQAIGEAQGIIAQLQQENAALKQDKTVEIAELEIKRAELDLKAREIEARLQAENVKADAAVRSAAIQAAAKTPREQGE